MSDVYQAEATAAKPHVGWRDFRLVLFGALLLLGLIAGERWLWFLQPLRLILGGIFVLYVPGYCLAAALFPYADDLDTIERTGLSLGLSIAIIPLLALLLDKLPWGLRLWPILLGEYGVIALCSAVALARRAFLPTHEAYTPALRPQPRSWWRGLSRLERRVYLLCSGALLIAGLASAWVFLVPAPDTFMTEFYMLGAEGMAEDYPREAAVGEQISVTLGITNRERDTFTYRAEVWAVNLWEAEQRQLVASVDPLTLAPGESYEQPITWAMPWAGDDQTVELYLFTGQSPEPYRRLKLWLNVRPEGS